MSKLDPVAELAAINKRQAEAKIQFEAEAAAARKRVDELALIQAPVYALLNQRRDIRKSIWQCEQHLAGYKADAAKLRAQLHQLFPATRERGSAQGIHTLILHADGLAREAARSIEILRGEQEEIEQQATKLAKEIGSESILPDFANPEPFEG